MLALEELKLYDFNQEKMKFTKQILEKEREKIMEDEIFNHVANYLRETKEKVKKEIGDWNKNVNEKNKVIDDKKQKLEKRKENKNKKIEETQIEYVYLYINFFFYYNLGVINTLRKLRKYKLKKKNLEGLIITEV